MVDPPPPLAALAARIVPRVGDIAPAAWDACAGTANPFVAHAFLSALEDSGSATARTGWQGAHIIIDGADGTPAAILPAYAKSHSQGEYVFDHGWADAWERAGGHYYPKLQACVPFTPATGPRLLLRDAALGPWLIRAAETVVADNGLSSAHATFLDPAQAALFKAEGWLMRSDRQFHWENPGYASFEDFLGALSSRKRKAIRRERAQALADGLTVAWLRGAQITEAHWDAFWHFYQDTGARKWGRPYLTRAAFSLLGERLGARVLLMLACRGAQPIAGTLSFVGADTLYGRYWGCSEEVPFLHFELCYHQAIDWAIAHRLARVEAGAQGEHKLARGYRPVLTWSAHHIADPRLRAAVAEHLAHEREAVAAHAAAEAAQAPFRQDAAAQALPGNDAD